MDIHSVFVAVLFGMNVYTHMYVYIRMCTNVSIYIVEYLSVNSCIYHTYICRDYPSFLTYIEVKNIEGERCIYAYIYVYSYLDPITYIKINT